MRCRDCTAYNKEASQCRKHSPDFSGKWPKVNPDKENNCRDYERVLESKSERGEKIEKNSSKNTEFIIRKHKK